MSRLCILAYIWILQLAAFIPVWSQDHREVTAVMGNTAILPCSVDHVGTQQVIWKDPMSNILTINEQSLTGDRHSVLRPYIREWNLQIEHVRKADQGTYTCLINSTPVKNKFVSLIVWYPPTITDSSMGDVAAQVGDNVVFRCNATGFPSPTVTWYKYHMTGIKEEVAHDRTTFELRNVSATDGGTFECEADNGVAPADGRTFKLDIQFVTTLESDVVSEPGTEEGEEGSSTSLPDDGEFAPTVQIPYGKVSQEMGQDTLLECLISANPLSAAWWERGGVRLEDDVKYRLHLWEIGGYTRTLGVFIHDLQPYDYGEYTCVAENQFGRIRDTTLVYELHSGDLRVLQTPKDALVKSGASVYFNCSVEGLSNRDTLIWWHRSPSRVFHKIFSSQADGSTTFHNELYFSSMNREKYEIRGYYNLHVLDVTFDDAGTYICEVSGYKNHSAELTVIGSPHCDSNGTLEEGQTAKLLCVLPYSGSSVDWRVDWEHGDRKLSSINEDSPGLVKRYVSFRSTYRDSGVYDCIISNHNPAISTQCTTALSVTLPSNPGANVGDTLICPDQSLMMDIPMVVALMAAAAGVLFLLFVCILAAVVVNFRRKIRKYNHSPRSVRYKNGSLRETERAALTSPTSYDEQTEV